MDASRDQLLPGEWQYDGFMSRELEPYLKMTTEFMHEYFADQQ